MKYYAEERRLFLSFLIVFFQKIYLFLACNRTYYGEVGITYEMEIHRPKVNQLPFACLLTFHAGADGFGDIVQVSIYPFTNLLFIINST